MRFLPIPLIGLCGLLLAGPEAFGLSAPPPATQLVPGDPLGDPPTDPLVEARRAYQISLASLARVEKKLAELEADPGADPDALAAYRSYRDRLEADLEAQRRALEARGLPPVEPGPALAEQQEEAARVAPTPGPVAAPEIRDEVGRLDRELNASLSDFDRVLMQKQEELANAESELSENEDTAMSSATERAEEFLRKMEEQGGEEGEEGEEGAEGSEGEEGETGEPGAEGEMAEAGEGEEGEEGQEGEEGEGEEGEGIEMAGLEGEGLEGTGEEGAGEEGAEGEVTGEPGVDFGDLAGQPGGPAIGGGPPPGGTRSGSESGVEPGAGGAETEVDPRTERRRREMAKDDDIVARQLREAAEAETDPALKETLWKEYETYKKGSRR